MVTSTDCWSPRNCLHFKHPRAGASKKDPAVSPRVVRTLLRFGVGLCGILLIVFAIIQAAPGGPVDRFFFALYEKAIIGDTPRGPIR